MARQGDRFVKVYSQGSSFTAHCADLGGQGDRRELSCGSPAATAAG